MNTVIEQGIDGRTQTAIVLLVGAGVDRLAHGVRGTAAPGDGGGRSCPAPPTVRQRERPT